VLLPPSETECSSTNKVQKSTTTRRRTGEHKRVPNVTNGAGSTENQRYYIKLNLLDRARVCWRFSLRAVGRRGASEFEKLGGAPNLGFRISMPPTQAARGGSCPLQRGFGCPCYAVMVEQKHFINQFSPFLDFEQIRFVTTTILIPS
jgi:hypothetical protein